MSARKKNDSTDHPQHANVQPSLFDAPPSTTSNTAAEATGSWLSVAQVVDRLSRVIEADATLGQPMLVRGELSNVKRSSRGHVYFTLKDDQAALSAVIWSSVAARLPFELADGLDVFATGQLDVYAPNGSISLVCKKLEPVGQGTLQLAFEQIKAKLDAEGLFDDRHKKPLPPFPLRIGLVTSSTGAVVHDMLRVLRAKNPLVSVLLYPVTVQGQGAADSIAQAITELNHPRYGLDLIIAGRGGGSFEDLFCFSEEAVVRAIFNAHLPVITGVGHEPDYSLADAVADYSASTPTAAAEAAVPDLDNLRAWCNEARSQLQTFLQHRMMMAEQRFDLIATGFVDAMTNRLNQMDHRLQLASQQMTTLVVQQLTGLDARLKHQADALDTLSPLKTLARGYAVATTPASGHVLDDATTLTPGDTVRVRLAKGAFEGTVNQVIDTR
ncbi:MAG: exodeoxyribonuclease VII large subunit [Vampirovibrionales bacterium]|nr:exodeoxyribonuclease VII large subunit [Cyanobacteria bacterium HKST-UBA03]